MCYGINKPDVYMCHVSMNYVIVGWSTTVYIYGYISGREGGGFILNGIVEKTDLSTYCCTALAS